MSEGMDELADRFRGCLLGLAVGDAVGTTLEFRARGSFRPIDDMVGGGPFRLKAGQWTDDTSLALCLATSLVEREAFDPDDQMKRYCAWWRQGYLSSTGECFDIGMTTRQALENYERTGEALSGPTDKWSAGNGSIMRLAPAPMFAFPDEKEAAELGARSSRTTHGAAEAVDACRLMSLVLVRALAGESKNTLLRKEDGKLLETESVRQIAAGGWGGKSREEIAGSGYVVKSLEAALWCLWKTGTFREAVLEAVNLGDDADTTGAVCGQMAGAFYGASGIPAEWLKRLAMREEIGELADRLLALSRKRQAATAEKEKSERP